MEHAVTGHELESKYFEPSMTSTTSNKYKTYYCRLCMAQNDTLSQLFTSDETDALAITLSMKVSMCTSIRVSKNDMLSQKICQNCMSYINEWYLFRKKCREVNLLLKQKLSTNTESFLTSANESQEESTGSFLKNGDLTMTHEIGLTLSPTLIADNDPSQTNDTPICHSDSPSLLADKREKFKCPSCPDSFYFLKDLKSHTNLLHSPVPDVSPSQPAVATVRPETVRTVDPDIELKDVHVRPRYEMKCCNKVFFSKATFRRHYNRRHPGEKPFMCETCGKKDFISEETLKRHKVLHTGKFRCDVCSKTFTCNAILVLHKRDKHENDRPFVCDVCGKRFVSELLMNYHKRFHTGEKKYVCEECGLAVVTSSSLAKHKRTHSKEKPHGCQVCGKGFITKGRLVEHTRMHTGERPYVCQVCQKGFTVRDKLKRHLHVHSGEKHFSCEYCGNTYSTKYGLSVHLKSHLALK